MAFEDVLKSLKVKGNFTHLGTSIKGSSSSPVTLAAAGNMDQLYVSSTATSGDVRANYTRLYIAGVGGAGEAIRAFTTINNVAAAGAHGIHASLSFGTSGSITGLGVAARATFQIPNAAMSFGTFAAVQSEVFSDGASSSIAGVTKFSMFRVVNGGDGTGMGTVDLAANLFEITGFAIGDNNMIRTNTATATHGIKIDIAGTRYDILLSNTHA